MFIRLITSTILTVLALTPLPALADLGSRLRASHPHLVYLLSVGEHRSPTFRNLIGRLEESDVIVHFESAPPEFAVDGGLQFVASTAFTRYLRVTLRTDLPAEELIALLGHELRHAVEVAESPEVRDELSFRRFYQIRGRATNRGRTVTYDTRAAIETGLRVAQELRLTHAWRSETAK